MFSFPMAMEMFSSCVAVPGSFMAAKKTMMA
jgi:hypothetical protein